MITCLFFYTMPTIGERYIFDGHFVTVRDVQPAEFYGCYIAFLEPCEPDDDSERAKTTHNVTEGQGQGKTVDYPANWEWILQHPQIAGPDAVQQVNEMLAERRERYERSYLEARVNDLEDRFRDLEYWLNARDQADSAKARVRLTEKQKQVAAQARASKESLHAALLKAGEDYATKPAPSPEVAAWLKAREASKESLHAALSQAGEDMAKQPAPSPEVSA